MKNSGISWTDHTFNPWMGCTKVGPGCDHCYAEQRMDKRLNVVGWGAGQRRKRTSVSYWREPIKWNDAEAGKFYAEHGRRQRVFCASLADVFDNEVDPQWRADLFTLIQKTPALDWLLLTKRIGNVQAMLPNHVIGGGLPENVWLGATICNQEEADRDIPKLLAVPAAVRFLSMEPLLGPVSLRWLPAFSDNAPTTAQNPIGRTGHLDGLRRIDWVIVGGESSPAARPMHPDWARSLRDQCAAAGVPFLFKQWGEYAPTVWFDGPDSENDEIDFIDLDTKQHIFLANDGRTWDTMGGKFMYPPLPLGHWCLMHKVGKKAAGTLLDGRPYQQFPRVAA